MLARRAFVVLARRTGRFSYPEIALAYRPRATHSSPIEALQAAEAAMVEGSVEGRRIAELVEQTERYLKARGYAL